MAALLGMALGAGTRAAIDTHARNQYQRQQLAQMVFQYGLQPGNESVFSQPETKKLIESSLGKDALGFGLQAAKINSANASQFGAVMTGQSPDASMMGMGSSQGTINGGVAGPTPPGGSGGNPPASAPSGLNLTSPKTVEDWRALEQRYLEAESLPIVQNNPAYQKILADHLKAAQENIRSLQSEQNYQQTQERLTSQFQQGLAERKEMASAILGLHQDALASQEQTRAFMEQMASEHEENVRAQRFTTASQSLNTYTQKIAAMLTASSPASPATVNQLLRQRNAMARTLKQQADKTGIDYDPEQFEPLTIKELPGYVQNLTGGTMGSGTPELAPADTSDTGSSAVDDVLKKAGIK